MWSQKELIDKQAQFWGLMAKGSTLIAACDAVGVNRRTGRRWRQATGGQVPRKKPEPSGRYLSLDERLQIADLQLAGAGVRDIAGQIGRSPETVSRELSRNGQRPTVGESTLPMRRTSGPSCVAGDPRQASSTIRNWHRWSRGNCV